MNKKKNGFTIVELIVVLAIIAILIIMAVPKLKKYIENAQLISVLASAKTINNAIIAYDAEHITSPDLAWIKQNGYRDLSSPVIWHEDNPTLPLTKSHLDPYIDGDVYFVMGGMPGLVNDAKTFDVFTIEFVPTTDGPMLRAVYYNDPRLPSPMQITMETQDMSLFYYGTAIIEGQPMVVGALYFPGATNGMVPVAEFVEAYEKAEKINKYPY